MKRQPHHPVTIVYISHLLRKRHRKLVEELGTVLNRHCIRLRELSGAADIWVRDYAPIQRHDGVFVSYTYRPDYLGDCPRLVTDWTTVKGFPETWKVENSGLILDGGNVVMHGRSAIVTEKVLAENPDLSSARVKSRLRDKFDLKSLIMLPAEPGDVLGHADGMIAWAGPNRVLVNDYQTTYPSLHREIVRRLRKSQIEPVLIPYGPSNSRRTIPPATGVYTNLLILPQLVLMPTYGIPLDGKALRHIEVEFSDRPAATVDCSALATKGGSIHCVTSTEISQP